MTSKRPPLNEEIICSSVEEAITEYRNRIHEMTGNDNLDILIKELKEEGMLSQSFKADYDKTRLIVEKALLEDFRSDVVPARKIVREILKSHISNYSDEIEKV